MNYFLISLNSKSGDQPGTKKAKLTLCSNISELMIHNSAPKKKQTKIEFLPAFSIMQPHVDKKPQCQFSKNKTFSIKLEPDNSKKKEKPLLVPIVFDSLSYDSKRVVKLKFSSCHDCNIIPELSEEESFEEEEKNPLLKSLAFKYVTLLHKFKQSPSLIVSIADALAKNGEIEKKYLDGAYKLCYHMTQTLNLQPCFESNELENIFLGLVKFAVKNKIVSDLIPKDLEEDDYLLNVMSSILNVEILYKHKSYNLKHVNLFNNEIIFPCFKFKLGLLNKCPILVAPTFKENSIQCFIPEVKPESSISSVISFSVSNEEQKADLSFFEDIEKYDFDNGKTLVQLSCCKKNINKSIFKKFINDKKISPIIFDKQRGESFMQCIFCGKEMDEHTLSQLLPKGMMETERKNSRPVECSVIGSIIQPYNECFELSCKHLASFDSISQGSIGPDGIVLFCKCGKASTIIKVRYPCKDQLSFRECIMRITKNQFDCKQAICQKRGVKLSKNPFETFGILPWQEIHPVLTRAKQCSSCKNQDILAISTYNCEDYEYCLDCIQKIRKLPTV